MGFFQVNKQWRQAEDFRVYAVGFIILLLPTLSNGCWGNMAPKYGYMTDDYNLLVGDELVLNCTLNSHYVRMNPHDNATYVNSSLLLFRRGMTGLSDLVHTIDGLTAQLRIPVARLEDSGYYYCELAIPNIVGEQLVCGSKVSMGYPPKPVKNFQCLSLYYENLTCTWDIANSRVETKYVLNKHHFFSKFFENPQLQSCPSESSNNTYCQWREDTDPPFEPKEEVFTFVLIGNNSLGSHTDTFTVKHNEIFVPNYPQFLRVKSTSKKKMDLVWSPPNKMELFMGQPPLQYQLLLQEMTDEESEAQVIDVGIDIFSHTISNLIPHMMYNISVRCRSKFASGENMWSPLSSVQNQTLSDVPYHAPITIPEAYELHHYDKFRAVTLYWKSISTRLYNGDNFSYYIICSLNNTSLDEVESKNVTSLSTTFNNLREDSIYVFSLYSMNEHGLSNVYHILVLEAQKNIPSLPEDITAISHDLGHYELSWKPPSILSEGVKILDYVVFWCSSLKPWHKRCEGPIHWINSSLENNKVTLNLSDSTTNFQFAVVSRTSVANSGMKWATCIVPYKAALGKISDVFVEPKNSTSLKIIWRLNCAAQKAVVKKFEIVYCDVDEKKQCRGERNSVEIMESSAENFLLQNLLPYSNYSIVIRAYNLADVPSEDSDPKLQATMQGAPADPPQDIKVVSTSNASLHLSWRSPRRPNGIITHYQIRYNNNVKEVEVEEPQEKYEIDLVNLRHYLNYSIQIQACVGVHLCSHVSAPMIATTDIGVPGVMDPPRVEAINSTLLKVSWNRPSQANGPIDFYEVQWQKIENNNASEETKIDFKVASEGTSVLVEVSCSNFENGGIKYMFAIRAANVKDGVIMYGPVSSPTQARACLLSTGVAMIVGAAIGGTLALTVVLLLVYKLIKWMSKKIHQVKSISVRLPKGLDSPENNPLNNYENFKNGLIQQTLTTSGLGHLSYIVEDGDSKNRHGSGSSQYSYSSTEELLYKNGKCTKFSRKPSGESSGCSSLSSNLTKSHASSESSTESDFMMPPSPDIVFSDHGSHKSTLPIVLEDKDSVTLDEMSKDGEHQDNVGNTVLSIDQPLSKFSVSSCGTSLPPCWMNSLAFYSLNLSNSEPTVKDIKDPVHLMMPYSKLGIAKSSGDIIGFTTTDMDLGYSRLGIVPGREGTMIHSLSMPYTKYNHAVDGKYVNGIVILPNQKKPIDASIMENPYFSKMNEASGKSVPSFFPISTEEKSNEDNGYIKFRRSTPLTLKSSYVPFSDVSSFSKTSYPLSAVSVVDDDSSKLEFTNNELFPLDLADIGLPDMTPQKYVEYNPDAVAVIFTNSMDINPLPLFHETYECDKDTSGELNVNSLVKNFVRSGYGDSFSKVKNESVNESSESNQPCMAIDLSSITTEDTSLAENVTETVESAEADYSSMLSYDLPSNCLPKDPTNVNAGQQDAYTTGLVSTFNSDDKKTAPNGYVPLSAFSNFNVESSVPNGKSDGVSPIVTSAPKEASGTNSIPPVFNNSICKPKCIKQTNSDCGTKYKVYPLPSDIPKFHFSDESDLDTDAKIFDAMNHTGFKFMPLPKSEYCEV